MNPASPGTPRSCATPPPCRHGYSAALPAALAAPERCLDRQLAERLTDYYRCPYAALPGGLKGALRLWQWEFLVRSLLHASEEGLRYRRDPGRERALALLRDSEAAHGLPPLALLPVDRDRSSSVEESWGNVFSWGGNPEEAQPGVGVRDLPPAARDRSFRRMPAVASPRPAGQGSQYAASPRPAGQGSLYAPDRRPDPEKAAAALVDLLAGLPRTRPAELADAPESFLAVNQDAVEGIISLPTSGTTGRGKRVYCSAGDLARTAAFFQYGMQYMVLPGRADRVALLMSGDRPGSVGDLLQRGMRDLGVPCAVPGFVRPGPEGERAMLRQLEALRPTCLVGVPTQMIALARQDGAARLRPFVRAVLLSGDAVTDPLRAGIADGFGCPVFVHYGLTETGLGGAVECRERAGCHMREADLIFEVLDQAGRALPAGECGEICLTTLTREAMPLLRYRTGDEGCLVQGDCACGSVFGRIRVLGRLDRRLALPDGILRLADLDRLLYALPWVRGYTATLHRAATDAATGGAVRDCLVLGLELADGAPVDAPEQAGRALAGVPGVRLVHAPADLAGGGPALPILVRGEREAEDAAEAARRQAKQVLHSTLEPVFRE